MVAARIAGTSCPAVTISASIAAASGCRPSPSSATICSSRTCGLAGDPGNPSAPWPSHIPGGLAALRVVVAEAVVAAVRCVLRSHLTGQVRVLVARVSLGSDITPGLWQGGRTRMITCRYALVTMMQEVCIAACFWE